MATSKTKPPTPAPAAVNWQAVPRVSGLRAKLAELKDRRGSNGRILQAARERTVQAEQAVFTAEVNLAGGKGSRAEYDAARQRYELARAELRGAAETMSGQAIRAAIAECAEALQVAEREERAKALAAFRPMYAERLGKLFAALDAVLELDIAAREAYEVGAQVFGKHIYTWPRPLSFFAKMPSRVGAASDYDELKRQAREAGLLE